MWEGPPYPLRHTKGLVFDAILLLLAAPSKPLRTRSQRVIVASSDLDKARKGKSERKGQCDNIGT
jgi:hypothetical protein